MLEIDEFKLPKEITDKYSVNNNAFIRVAKDDLKDRKDKIKQAYFCAPCKNRENDSEKAIELSIKLGLKLWIPKKEVVNYNFPDGALLCKKAIDESEAVICQPPIGRDCAWELGYAVAKNKLIYVIGKLDNSDWMTKLGNIIYV